MAKVNKLQEVSPLKAARMGRDCDRPLCRDWSMAKNDVIRVAFSYTVEDRALFPEIERYMSLMDEWFAEHSYDDQQLGWNPPGSWAQSTPRWRPTSIGFFTVSIV